VEEKVIELYFRKDNIVEGTIKMRTIKAIKFKREQFEQLKKEALKISGIYLLFGSVLTEDVPETNVYVGKTSEITSRLNTYKNAEDKEFWTETVILTTIDDSLGETDIKYLESKLIELIKQNNRCRTENKVNPTAGNVSNAQRCYLNTYVEDAKLIIMALGYNILESYNIEKMKKTDERWHIEGKAYNADMIFTSDKEVILLKGSTLGDVQKSLQDNIKKLREEYKGQIKNNTLQEDIVLKSPNIAAKFITGNSVSWKWHFLMKKETITKEGFN